MAVRVIGTVAAMALAAAVGWFGVVTFVEPRSTGRHASISGTEAVPAAAESEDAPVATMTPPAQVAPEPGPAAGADSTFTPERRGDEDRSEGPGRFGNQQDETTQ